MPAYILRLFGLHLTLRCYNHAEVRTELAYSNQHSFTITGLLSITVLGFLTLRDGLQPIDLVGLVALITGLLIASSLLRTGESTLDGADEVLNLIGTRPILLEFYSNY